jgi:hypothetical protein
MVRQGRSVLLQDCVKWKIPFIGILDYSACPTFTVETIGTKINMKADRVLRK